MGKRVWERRREKKIWECRKRRPHEVPKNDVCVHMYCNVTNLA